MTIKEKPKYLTNQEIFSKVYAHLLTQGRRAINAEGSCRYRTKEGLTCAVGCLISEEAYIPAMEGMPIDQMAWDKHEYVRRILRASGVSKRSISLLSKLQYIHDKIALDYWESDLAECAKAFRLSVPLQKESL